MSLMLPLIGDASFLPVLSLSEEKTSVFHLCFPDIDECSQPEPVCTEEHRECVNTKGSYDCRCSSGYEEQDGECVQTVEPGEDQCSFKDLFHVICALHILKSVMCISSSFFCLFIYLFFLLHTVF